MLYRMGVDQDLRERRRSQCHSLPAQLYEERFEEDEFRSFLSRVACGMPDCFSSVSNISNVKIQINGCVPVV